ncbi:MAG: FAD-dependent oxidoreductase [Actinomycetota bacterium]|nr:FAD-dependent oxidoreductase [Actinomycetota bacterium]
MDQCGGTRAHGAPGVDDNGGISARSRTNVLFEPGQEFALQADIVRPEGRVLFAGEHCSLWHAWIQGALESGIHAAMAIHNAPEPTAAPERAAQ